MNFEISVPIAAAPDTVWRLLTDVERWPDLTASMSRVEIVSDGPFGLGSKARVHQPRLPAALWTVTAFEPGRSFTWESSSPGVTTVGTHDLDPGPDGATLRLSLDQTGPLSPLIALLAGRLTRRYVTMEAQGLKAKAEDPSR